MKHDQLFGKKPRHLLALLPAVFLALVTTAAVADTFTVTNANDSGGGSLRQAILDADAATGADAIEFNGGLRGQSISLSGPLVIAGDLTINGLGRDQLTIDGNGRDIFRINVGRIAVTFTGVTLEDGGEAIQINGSGNAVTLINSKAVDARGDDGLRVDGGRNNITVINTVFERNEDNIQIGNEDNILDGRNNILEIINSTSRLAGDDGVAISGNANTVTVRSSTVSQNGLDDPNDGIDVNGNDNVLNLQQVTISSNGEHGLDIEGERNLVSVKHSTIVNNASDGLILQDDSRTSIMFVNNNIVAGNRGERSSRSDVFDAFNSNGFVSGGYNLIGNGAGASTSFDGPGDQVGTPNDPINAELVFGPLQDNGGPTFTHALLPDSPAIDAGDPNFTPPPDFDQRGPGFLRVRNGTIDIGALEAPVPPSMPPVTPPVVPPEPRPDLSIDIVRCDGNLEFRITNVGNTEVDGGGQVSFFRRGEQVLCENLTTGQFLRIFLSEATEANCRFALDAADLLVNDVIGVRAAGEGRRRVGFQERPAFSDLQAGSFINGQIPVPQECSAPQVVPNELRGCDVEIEVDIEGDIDVSPENNMSSATCF